MQEPHFDRARYGSMSHMLAQWEAHNTAYQMATGSSVEKWLIERISGGKADRIAESSKELDLRPIGNTTRRQDVLYLMIEVLQ